ncbi:hypothetical protein GCM10027044_19080 [Hymenobacter ruber]
MLSACKKEDTRTKEELLQASHWKVTAEQRVDVVAGGTPVITNSPSRCSTPNSCYCDDYIAFLPNHQLDRNEGALQCTYYGSAAGSGKWYIDQKDQTLVASYLTGYQGYWAFKIEELSANTLKVSNQIVNGTTVSTFYTTFKAE